jgi:hypothetical protein
MADESLQRVVVTVDDQHLPAIQGVADALQLAGLQITSVLPTTGIITGEISQASVKELRSVPGVASIEPDQEMRAM